LIAPEGLETIGTAGQETGGTTDIHPSEYKSFAGDPGLEPGVTVPYSLFPVPCSLFSAPGLLSTSSSSATSSAT